MKNKGLPFILTLLGLLGFAWLFPALGGGESVLPVSRIKVIGVFLLFFNQGVLLPTESLKRGVTEWRLHLLVQATTFVVFPLLVGVPLWLTGSWFDHPDLHKGFYFLSILPTTVSSAVALTSVAKGNVVGAVFNCTLSSLLGVVIVPFYCLQVLGAEVTEGQGSYGGLITSIALTVLLPLMMGQGVRPVLGTLFAKHRKAISRFNQGVILFMIWTAFCQSFLREVWGQVSTMDLLQTAGGVMVLLLIVSGMTWKLSEWIGLSRESRITAFYCGSQKTLAMGLPLSVLIFSGSEGVELSLLLIPLLLYHPLQLIFGGLLSPKISAISPELDQVG